MIVVLFKFDTVQYTQIWKRAASNLQFSQRSFGEMHMRHVKIEIKMWNKKKY